MKINKFKKLKNGQYQLFLEEDHSLILHEDLILKYDLLLTKEIDPMQEGKILEENLSYIAYDLAVKYLTKRMRSEFEVREYLRKQKVAESIIDEVISKLKKQGYLNEEQFVEAYVTDKIHFSMDGPAKIEKQLQALGIGNDAIRLGKEFFTTSCEEEKVKKIITHMVKTNRNKSEKMLKRKIQDHLISEGYSYSIILTELSKLKLNTDSSIQKKEYDKIYRKLSRKYSGDELKYKVKQKMYALGFSGDSLDD